MAGAYCRFCNTRCFVYRVVLTGMSKGWSGHMATCGGGRDHDAAQLGGVDHRTAYNPMTGRYGDDTWPQLCPSCDATDPAAPVDGCPNRWHLMPQLGTVVRLAHPELHIPEFSGTATVVDPTEGDPRLPYDLTDPVLLEWPARGRSSMTRQWAAARQLTWAARVS